MAQFLAFAAQTKGAAGAREYLQERRQQAPDVLQELGAVVLLHEGDADLGIQLETLPLRVQREIWSALASGASPDGADVVLARAFIRVAGARRRESDAVCLALARMVLSGVEDGEEQSTTADAAFRRRLKRLTLARVTFPSQDEDAAFNGHQRSTPLHAGAASSLRKRQRQEIRQDLRTSEMESEEEARAGTTSSVKSEEGPPLAKETEDRASALAKQLAQLSRADALAAVDDVASRAFAMLAEVVNDVHTTYTANERSFQYLCKLLRMESTSDEALSQITSALVDANWSSRYAAIFLETSVLPKIRAADSVISRVLLQAALRFGSSYASTLVDSLLLPLLVGKNADTNGAVGPAQAEAITRILRSPDAVPADQLDGFLLASLNAVAAKNDSASSPHLLSNESALLVFQNVLNTKPVLSPRTVERFVGACEAVLERPGADQVRGSLKFATVMFTLISKYPQQCAGHVETLEAIATQLTSIMAKTTLRSLQKLKTSK